MPWGTGWPAEMSSAWHKSVLAGAAGREAQGWEPAWKAHGLGCAFAEAAPRELLCTVSPET